MQKRMVVGMFVVSLLLVAVSTMAAGWQQIDAKGVKEMMENEDPLVVFPLSRIEYNNLHIPGSVNIPLSRLEGNLPSNMNQKLVFYCLGKKCTASPQAADKAVAMGYKNVFAFIEGLPGWIKAGYSTETIERLPLASIRFVEPEKLKTKLDENAETIIIDIRHNQDLNLGKLNHRRTLQIPLDDLADRLDEIPRDAEIVIMCTKGKRGPTAVRYLSGKGYDNVSCLKGGITAWKKAGLPMS